MTADEGEDMRLCSPQLQDRNGVRTHLDSHAGGSSTLPLCLGRISELAVCRVLETMSVMVNDVLPTEPCIDGRT